MVRQSRRKPARRNNLGGLVQFAIKGFQWDPAKNRANLLKHGIDFEDAKEVFYESIHILQSDRPEELRWIAIGPLEAQIIAVIFTIRDEQIRIISARRARKHEERAYRNKENR